jgi:hypothetical protein
MLEADAAQAPQTTVWQGIRLTLLLHLFQIPMGLLTFLVSPIAIGISQLAYMLPAIIIARKRKETEKAQGLIIGASVTFLLNAACFGAFALL